MTTYNLHVPVRPSYYLVLDDNTFRRLRKNTFYRIMLQHEDEVHPEFKGQRVKYAAIYIQYDGHRPIAVRRATFGVITFDENGRFDDTQWQRQAQLVVEGFPHSDEVNQPHLTDARVARANEEYGHEYGWEPTPSLRKQLYDAALHNKLTGAYLS